MRRHVVHASVSAHMYAHMCVIVISEIKHPFRDISSLTNHTYVIYA